MKKLIFGVLLSLLFVACTDDNTKEITNPAELNVVYELIKNTDNSGGTTQYIRAMVFNDEYQMYDEIKDGGITFNGQELPYYEQTSYYYAEPEIVDDSLYTFRLTLSNGKQYLSSIRTPEYFLGSVYVQPVTFTNTNSTVSIEWTDTIAGAEVLIELYAQPFNDDESVLIYDATLDDHGSCTITSGMLPAKYQDIDISNASFRIFRKEEGEISAAFNTEEIYVYYNYIYQWSEQK